MATSSITHNFVISNPNSVKHFIAAIDEADRDRTPKQTEYSCAVTPQVRQTGNRLSGLAGTAYASLLA